MWAKELAQWLNPRLSRLLPGLLLLLRGKVVSAERFLVSRELNGLSQWSSMRSVEMRLRRVPRGHRSERPFCRATEVRSQSCSLHLCWLLRPQRRSPYRPSCLLPLLESDRQECHFLRSSQLRSLQHHFLTLAPPNRRPHPDTNRPLGQGPFPRLLLGTDPDLRDE